ncbi:hypothetical protein J4476_03015 [Candidatus Woesearchaeota archaeon]|nr:hypothetical protein [Candidatus Woesearchaeota archaeon]HIH25164.1 hypothetical protein [Nanoarchaeota archaeon]
MGHEYITLDKRLDDDVSRLRELVANFTRSIDIGVLERHYVSTTFDHSADDVTTVHAGLSLSVPWFKCIPYPISVLTLDLSVNGYPIYGVADRINGHRSCLSIDYNHGIFVFSPKSSRNDLKDYFRKIDPKIHVFARNIKELFDITDFRFVKK